MYFFNKFSTIYLSINSIPAPNFVQLSGRGFPPTGDEITSFADLLSVSAGPDPSVLLVDVVAGGPVLEAGARLLGHLLQEEVALGRRLDVDEAAALRHQLARLLRLDPPHPVAAEVVATRAQLHEGARTAEVCKFWGGVSRKSNYTTFKYANIRNYN